MAMTQDEMIATFEALWRDIGIDPAAAADASDWWSTNLEGRTVQGGVHYDDVRIFISISDVDVDADIDALYADIAAKNAALPKSADVRYVEEDNYIQVRGLIPLADVTPAGIRALLKACMTVADSDAAAALGAKYQSW
ncbi:MAG: hypothetical protein KC486_26685 [Myxococcales bacterium]|nr:hypothetical protein [Myxococcales bacterium]